MNEELSEIVSLVSRYTEVPVNDIINGHKPNETRARGYVCYIVYNAYPHLRLRLCTTAHISPGGVAAASRTTEHRIKHNVDIRVLINDIRRELNLQYIKKDVDSQFESDTRRLFGFDYADDDIRDRKRAMANAKIHMDRLCSFGRQPLVGGMVFTRMDKSE